METPPAAWIGFDGVLLVFLFSTATLGFLRSPLLMNQRQGVIINTADRDHHQ